MSELVCVTNIVDGFTPCVEREKHYAVCDGFEWRRTDAGELATGRVCPGCVPKEALQGQLCWGCWESVRKAVNDSAEYMEVISGVQCLVSVAGGGGGSSEPQLPLPVTALLLDELNSYLRGFHGNADQWVETVAGATDAVKFARAFRAAVKNHPIKEAPHDIKRTRCPDCEQLTLVWFPPAHQNNDVRVSCRNSECDYETDQDKFAELVTSGGRT